MDHSTSENPAGRPHEEGSERLVFSTIETGISAGHDPFIKAGISSQEKKPRLNRLPAVVIVIGAYAVALVFGLASEREKYSGPSSFTVQLPPAAQNIAAVNALPPPNVLKPIPPDEATKENSERPFVSRPDSSASRFVLRTDPEDRTRALACLAQAVYYEAANEETDGGRAIAQVVLNRVRHPGFPSTICGVIYQGADRASGCQFSFTCDGSMRRIPVPKLWARSRRIAEDALRGRVFAPVGHATHYHADYVLPYWADSLDKSVQVGRHIFYRLRSVFGEPNAFSQHYAGLEPPVRKPGAAIMLPQTAEAQRLADTLIEGASQHGERMPTAASPKPVTPLIIDSSPSRLLVDSGNEPSPPREHKAASDCTLLANGKQLAPLRATDMRSQSSQPVC